MIGRLIVFEGIDGCGKGTHIQLLDEALKKSNFDPERIVHYKQPGATALGNKIRKVLFDGEISIGEVEPDAISLLFLAAHIEGVKKVIIPALSQGKLVISDRWSPFSDAVFGKFGLKHSVRSEVIDIRNRMNMVQPDHTFFLYGDVECLLTRAKARTTENHQQHKPWSSVSKLWEIQNAYNDMFQYGRGHNVTYVNVNRTVEEIFTESIWPKMKDILSRKFCN